MIEIISYLLLATPFLLAAILPLVGVTWVVVGSRSIMLWVVLYFSLLLYFPNASWGVLDPGATRNFYTRGTGALYFSAINVLLFGLVFQALAARVFKVIPAVKNNLTLLSIFFWVIIFGNVLVGVFSPDIRWFEIVGYSGLMNVANFMFAFYVLMSVVKAPEDLDKLVNVFLFCALTRGLWGAFRFVAMGGDPANFYANFQGISVRLTFFDINDSLIATVAVFIAGWRLAKGMCPSARQKILCWSIVILELFIVVFSYRRTAWGGLALAALLFAFSQKKALRWNLLVSYALVGVPALIYKMVQRSGHTTEGASLIERILPDIASRGEFSFTTGRFAELYAAFLSIRESPVWGLGAWGRYDGFRFPELAWHRGDFSWMHSGVLHLALKSGLLGAGISIAVLVAVWRFVVRHKDELPPKEQGILLAGAAGVLFLLPNWLVGTPVIEYRTMQLSALMVALPYLAVAAARMRQA